MLYSELQCSEAIHKAVERMGFAEMTEVQEKTIPVMLAGRDVIAKAPTGTGKTCASVKPVLRATVSIIWERVMYLYPPGTSKSNVFWQILRC